MDLLAIRHRTVRPPTCFRGAERPTGAEGGGLHQRRQKRRTGNASDPLRLPDATLNTETLVSTTVRAAHSHPASCGDPRHVRTAHSLMPPASRCGW